MEDLEWTAWFFGVLGAVFVGLGKGGLPGMGNITVALYALALPDPKMSVGVLLPVLSASDVVAVSIYKKHGQWVHLRRLLPWAFIGVVVGYALFRSLSADHVRILIGVFLLFFTMVHFGRLLIFKSLDDHVPDHFFFRTVLGVLGGFATMVANAAGPIASFYFISMRLPKYAFIGTTAWFFLIINAIKVPFMIELGIINLTWFPFSLTMMPFAIAATMIAPKIVALINQELFEKLIWFFIVVAGVKLLLG